MLNVPACIDLKSTTGFDDRRGRDTSEHDNGDEYDLATAEAEKEGSHPLGLGDGDDMDRKWDIDSDIDILLVVCPNSTSGPKRFRSSSRRRRDYSNSIVDRYLAPHSATCLSSRCISMRPWRWTRLQKSCVIVESGAIIDLNFSCLDPIPITQILPSPATKKAPLGILCHRRRPHRPVPTIQSQRQGSWAQFTSTSAGRTLAGRSLSRSFVPSTYALYRS